MDLTQKDLLLKLMAEKGDLIADDVYTFFQGSKELAGTLRNTDLAKQKKRLIEGLIKIINLSEENQELAEYLEELGIRHISYEVQDNHYPIIEDALVSVMRKHAREYEIDFDWQSFGSMITETMRSGANKLKMVV